MNDATATLDLLEADMSRSLYRCRYDRKHRDATIPVLLELLAVDDLAIKQRTMRAVATIGHCNEIGALVRLVPILCKDLQDEDELTRRTAVGALFAVGSDNPQAAVPALVQACDDAKLLDAALLALIEIGEAARPAAPCFRRFASHRHGKVRRLVMRGLGAVGADDTESRAILQTGVSDRNQSVREMALRVLGNMDTRQ